MKFLRSRSVLLAGLNLIIIGVLLYYFYSNADYFLELLHLSVTNIILILLLSSIFPFINGLINVYMFRSLKASPSLGLQDSFYLAAASTLANELPISGGIITKGVYLKRFYNVTYSKYFSATLALFFCTVAINGFIGLVILLYWIFLKKLTISLPLISSFTIMTGCSLIFLLPLEHIKAPDKLQKWISQILEGWFLISRNFVLLLRLLGLQTILFLLLAVRYWLAFMMLSQNVTISQAVLFSSATVLTQLVSIAPGGWGVREIIVGAISSSLGFDIGVSIAAVGLDRLISTAFNIFLGWYSMLMLGKRISAHQERAV